MHILLAYERTVQITGLWKELVPESKVYHLLVFKFAFILDLLITSM